VPGQWYAIQAEMDKNFPKLVLKKRLLSCYPQSSKMCKGIALAQVQCNLKVWTQLLSLGRGEVSAVIQNVGNVLSDYCCHIPEVSTTESFKCIK
jgi:hypothetical protein